MNVPFAAIAEDGVHTLPGGRPLVRVIPFRRHSDLQALVRAETDEDAAERARVNRSALAESGWCRRQSRARR